MSYHYFAFSAIQVHINIENCISNTSKVQNCFKYSTNIPLLLIFYCTISVIDAKMVRSFAVYTYSTSTTTTTTEMRCVFIRNLSYRPF